MDFLFFLMCMALSSIVLLFHYPMAVDIYSASSIIRAHIHIDRSVRPMADTGELEGPHPLQQRVGVVYRAPCGTCYKV